jgi:hypothetical protein
MEPDHIARYFRVSEKTLQKYYKEEISRGPFEANAKVGKTMFDMASDGETPAATMFWLRTRGGGTRKSAEMPASGDSRLRLPEKKAA